jgi:hypothetical protein
MRNRLKQLLLPKVFSAYLVLLQWARALGIIRVDRLSAMVLPPWSPGSLGDEAMMRSTVGQLQQHGYKTITVISYWIRH